MGREGGWSAQTIPSASPSLCSERERFGRAFFGKQFRRFREPWSSPRKSDARLRENREKFPKQNGVDPENGGVFVQNGEFLSSD